MDQGVQVARRGPGMGLAQVWNLPESIRVRLGDKSGRQRAMLEDGHLLLILHKMPEGGKPEREGVFFWRQPDGAWESTGRGGGLGMLRKHVADYGRKVDQLEDAYHEAKSAADYFHLLEVLGPLSRAAKNLRDALQAAREGVPEDRDIIDLRDSALDVARAVELVHMDAKNALEFEIAKQAEEQARAGQEMARIGHKLNVLAAIFLPLTAITSVFGMTSLRSGLEEAPPWLFWMIFASGLLLGFIIRSQLAAKKKTTQDEGRGLPAG